MTTTPDSPVPPPVFAGVDVSKGKLDLARSDAPDAVRAFDNTPDGVSALVAALRPPVPEVIAVEATGGYERPLVDALLDAGLPVAVVNPRHVRHFAKGGWAGRPRPTRSTRAPWPRSPASPRPDWRGNARRTARDWRPW